MRNISVHNSHQWHSRLLDNLRADARNWICSSSWSMWDSSRGRGFRCVAGSHARPGGKAILPAGYERYSGGSWSELARASPLIAGYMKLLCRMYGVHSAPRRGLQRQADTSRAATPAFEER